MARNIDSWQRELIIHMLCSKKRLTASQIAKVAKCSERSVSKSEGCCTGFGMYNIPPSCLRGETHQPEVVELPQPFHKFKFNQTQAFTGETQSSPREVQNDHSGSNHLSTIQ